MTSRHYLDTGQRTYHGDDGREVLCEGPSGSGVLSAGCQLLAAASILREHPPELKSAWSTSST